MNQILYVEGKKKNKPADIKKVVLFFSIAMIVLGIILVGQGSYAMIVNHKENENKPTIPQDTKPQVNVTKQDEDILIEVQHDKVIDKIVYQWNSEQAKTIEGNNRTTISETISLPFGTNMLNIKVIDSNGVETEYQKEYVVDGDGKPVIDLVLTKDNKIKITAQDARSLRYIVYTWNNGQETKIEANTENLQKIEQEIEIPIGQNTLKVEAVNMDNVISTKELEVKGIKGPTIELSRDGEYLVIKVQDDAIVERVEYTMNGKPYKVDVSTKNYASIQFKQKIEPGENLFVIKATNKEGGEKQITAKTTL